MFSAYDSTITSSTTLLHYSMYNTCVYGYVCVGVQPLPPSYSRCCIPGRHHMDFQLDQSWRLL